MPPLSREQLAARRKRRRAIDQRRHHRFAVRAALPFAIIGAIAALVVFAVSTIDRSNPEAGGIAPPVQPPSGAARLPQAVIIASAGNVDLRLPIERSQITAIVFRAVENPSAVALTPSEGLSVHIAPRGDRSGSDTASVDVGAPAKTAVYAPVTGVIHAIVPYRVAGRVEGYEVLINPDSAADRTVRMNHLETLVGSDRPHVRQPVREGETPIGQVRDFSRVAEQTVARYTADSGNHVHIEVERKPVGGLLP